VKTQEVRFSSCSAGSTQSPVFVDTIENNENSSRSQNFTFSITIL
jgi:hypothetical protein